MTAWRGPRRQALTQPTTQLLGSLLQAQRVLLLAVLLLLCSAAVLPVLSLRAAWDMDAPLQSVRLPDARAPRGHFLPSSGQLVGHISVHAGADRYASSAKGFKPSSTSLHETA